MEEPGSLLASLRDNGQLISPAVTPSDQKYARPFHDVFRSEDAADENMVGVKRAVPRTQTVEVNSDKLENGQVTPKRKGRRRSATLPSSSASASPVRRGINPGTPIGSTYDGSADVPKLSPAQIIQLTSTPDSIPIRALTPVEEASPLPL